ncbi:MAG TPA: NAD(P)(+) transhydrogenase (Re/Si-specific) subunit beta [Rhodopila sp.]|uniref:NAD(P)(+) transhydrogenase (Re/Si-specific) subunit beta n=1 Tax=Rhodopila sp. TaxID=2480087 RepID=UPI002C77B2A7|nr:NAD(P)(+) transhydrogenase (Re/Si-specific) subunit beta [Rhodopila sp.]HVY16454.1 NAD(P)(+) transhydrogenase (Re/Si-specific) subunit beta [Rhodopila sp.]
MNPYWIIDPAGFIAAVLFIYGLKRMSSPVTARSGIVVAGVGMLVAVLASFLYVLALDPAAEAQRAVNVTLAVVALGMGLGWAWWRGRSVAITAMPQMVALYNGMGGGAAAAIAAVELFGGRRHDLTLLIITVIGALIGSISLSGSVIAWGKLDGRINKPWRFGGQQALNVFVFLVAIAVGLYVAIAAPGPYTAVLTAAFFVVALLFGVLMTMPIGGADMPVVISLYNAFTGLAVGLEGLVLQNPALMIAGMVVGSAGTLLTLLMAKAMNRSISNVLFSNFGDVSLEQQGEIKGRLKPVEASDAAIAMRYASKVIIVPGYGLAAAQAQQRLYEFVKLLQAAGVEVKFAVHPVAGRMPGHMDVLLAEAGVPYDLIHEMDEINEEFSTTDVALVIGANDVVNPAARTNKTSPIYGMPILNVDQAHQIYVIKRGQGKGYAGVENELFYADNCNMVYGDAQAVLGKMVLAVKDLVASGAPAQAAA